MSWGLPWNCTLPQGRSSLKYSCCNPESSTVLWLGLLWSFFVWLVRVFVCLLGWLVGFGLVWFLFGFFCFFFKPNYYQIIPSKAPGKCISFHLRGALSHFVSLLRRSLLCQVCPHTCTCCEDSLESDCFLSTVTWQTDHGRVGAAEGVCVQ